MLDVTVVMGPFMSLRSVMQATSAHTAFMSRVPWTGSVLGKHDHELVPAVAGNHVGFTEKRAEDAGRRLDGFIAHRVTVRLVDVPEVVEVHHDEAEGLALLLGFGKVRALRVLEESTIVDTGQLVGDGTAAGALTPEHHFRDELAGAAQALRRDVEHPVHELQGDLGVLCDDIGEGAP